MGHSLTILTLSSRKTRPFCAVDFAAARFSVTIALLPGAYYAGRNPPYSETSAEAVCRSASHLSAEAYRAFRLYQPGAKDAGISYKSAWDAINDMNLLSEHTLVERATGGKGGGGRGADPLRPAAD
jgi:hypothetical protein